MRQVHRLRFLQIRREPTEVDVIVRALPAKAA
jgi:hypothetical protein